MTIVVPSVVRNTGLAHNIAPELLEFAQGLTRYVSGEQEGRVWVASLDNRRNQRRGLRAKEPLQKSAAVMV